MPLPAVQDRGGRPISTATSIEWTRGDDGSAGATWNPVTGRREVSAGCEHCYAKTFVERFRGVAGHPFEQGFDIRLWPKRLSLPFRWRKPRRVFVNSTSDLFIDAREVPGEFVARCSGRWRSSQAHLPGAAQAARDGISARPAIVPHAPRPDLVVWLHQVPRLRVGVAAVLTAGR
jgi:Protein of unknown function (DUF5131)